MKDAACSHCSGTGQVKCAACSGSGVEHSEYAKQLQESMQRHQELMREKEAWFKRVQEEHAALQKKFDLQNAQWSERFNRRGR